MKSLKSEWTEEELKQLAAIVAAGGTALRNHQRIYASDRDA
jgi:hypothetical protein